MFQKTLRTFIRQLGKNDRTYKRIYKTPKKYNKVTSEVFLTYCHSTKNQIMEKDDVWLKNLVAIGFPIDCSKMNSLCKSTIWNHIYTLYISAMKEKYSNIPSYLLSKGTETVEENKEEYEFALKIYEKLSVKSTPNILNSLNIPSNIHSLAIDIAKDLQNDDNIRKLAQQNLFSADGNPPSLESLMQKMSSDSSLQNLFSTVTNKIQQKIEDDEIDPEQLAKQADVFLQSMNMNPILETLKKNNTT